MERLKELQRASGAAPPPAPSRPSYHPDEMDPVSSPAVLPLPSGGPPARVFNKRPKRKRSFSELPWNDYFTTKQNIEVGEDKFCVYSTGTGPTLLCLHGGGHSSLSWAVFTAELTQRANVQVVALDQRGHGDTHTSNDKDLSAETLTADVGKVWETMYPNPEDRPPVVILGHSMGGAVAVRVAAQKLIPNIRGIVVIDVVEGSAMDALSAMQGVLKRRPRSFTTKRKAIEWVLKSGQIRNNESARVSMGAQLKPCKKKEKVKKSSEGSTLSALPEEGEEKTSVSSESETSFTWRVNLEESEVYWAGWYSGMSKLFLSVPAPKLLLLAGPDRLDTELTRAHMQGKFQVQMFNLSGHSVQEDLPDKVADVVSSFLVRQRFAQGTYNPETVRPCC